MVLHGSSVATSPARQILDVRSLKKSFVLSRGFLGSSKVVKAVENVSFQLTEGETLGIVGESGCGKSTTARLLMHLMPRDSGEIIFEGRRVGENLPLRQFRRKMQMVFQDSYASLNPRLTIEDSIAFGPQVHGTSRIEAKEQARDLLHRVGLSPAQFGHRYPHELSGGQRQRVNIARALAMKPKLLILDEAVSALDKSVEAQVLNLLNQLKDEFGLTYIFISHDLNVVRYMCDRVLVMYLGKVVEEGPSEEMFAAPSHPYTRGLLGAMPSGDPANRMQAPPLAGDPPDPIDPPAGCRFHPRCQYQEPCCSSAVPVVSPVGSGNSLVSCHMFDPASNHSIAPARSFATAASH